MFRDIVSRIPFSPALIGNLGFYARRLKKEEAVRRMGLIFTALALVVQSFAVFSPPESANAASENDMIYGGISTRQEILNAYKNNKRFRNVMDYAGITEQELTSTQVKTINNLQYGTGDKSWKSWGWNARFSREQGEVKHNANGTTAYSRPNYLYNIGSYEKKYGRNLKVYHGHSKRLGEFAIMFDCGNLISPNLPTPPPPPPPPAPAPVASCDGLSAIRHAATTYQLRAKASANYGAKISQYIFTVKNSNDATIKKFEINSSSYDITTAKFSLNTGEYKAAVVVKTSIGDKTGKSCETNITVPKPGVLIDKKIDSVEHKTVKLNQEFNYQVTVRNSGEIPLQNLEVTDSAPAGVVFIKADAGTVDPVKNSWKASVAQLNPSQSKTFIITAKVPRYQAGVIKNAACVDTPTIPGAPDDCDDATIDVPEPEIKVCELATDRVITIKQSAFNESIHSRNLDDCIKIQVCDRASGTIITIRQPQFDENRHSKDLTQCDDMQICDLETGEVKTIKKHEFNESRHSTDASDCVPKITSDKSAINLSQGGVDATTVTAQAGDRIQYTVRLHNIGNVDATSQYDEDLSDVLEYSRLTNRGGGEFDDQKSVLSWGEVKLAAGEDTSRSFTVTMHDDIPTTARGTNDPSSYDCIMTNTFGNSVNINVECAAVKSVEGAVTQLPKTGPGANMIFAGIVASIVIYFYARSRQLSTEVRLIRRDINAGVI